MVSNAQSVTFMLLLVMLFSGAIHGEEVTGIYGKPVQDGTTVNGIYYGKGYEENIGNLFIGGIGQRSQNPDANDQSYKSFSDDNSAIYVPTYYMGVDGQSREFNFIQDGLQVDYAAQGIRTPANGLVSPALNDRQYDTVIGYSGGTTAVVTAMALQNVKANTLILISPMRGGLDNVGQSYLESMGLGGTVVDEFDWNFDWQGEFEQKIQTILDAGTRIMVIQSEQDELPLGPDFQYRFSEDHDSRITVHDVTLIHEGIEAHSEIFFDHAMNHIKNGMYDPPTVQAFQVTPLSLAVGESSTIDYTVSDNDGPGLKQVELWRKDEQSDWQEIHRDEISGNNGPISGSFTDSPSASGKYWYGLHVVDNAGNWNDEKNSNTNNPSVSFEPIEVEIKSAQETGQQEPSTVSTQPTNQPITLPLYVHDGSASGPLIPGAQVTGQDGSGNSFTQITDENGFVVITGSPGSWQFTATKLGYDVNSWSQKITETGTKHAYLFAEKMPTISSTENDVQSTTQNVSSGSEASADSEVGDLINALKDNDAGVRLKAAEALGKLADARAVDPLIEALRYDEDGDVRQKAAWALGQIDDSRTIDPLSYASVKDAQGYVRVEAYDALQKSTVGGNKVDARSVDPIIGSFKGRRSGSKVQSCRSPWPNKEYNSCRCPH